MFKALEQSIIKTLAYFDIFDFPLTKEELFEYLWMPPRIGYEEFVRYLSLRATRGSEAISSVGESQIPPKKEGVPTKSGREVSANGGEHTPTPLNRGEFGVQEKYGYYFLAGREEIVESRRRALITTESKLKKARRAAKLIRSVPFLKAIFVCNSVGAEMANPYSDIDFFIITEKKRIWLVRFFTNLILFLLGLRRHGKKITDRICLSFYLDISHLDLRDLKIAENDIYLAYWLHQLMGVYDPENYYEKILEANQWTKKFLPNILTRMSANHPTGPSFLRRGGEVSPPARGGVVALGDWGGGSNRRMADFRIGYLWKRIWEAMWRGLYGDLLEKQAEGFQRVKMKFTATREGKPVETKGVVVGEGVLKFHEEDRRRYYKEEWEKKIKFLGIT